ncbi:TonB-dependent receptor family protein [Pendulispora albinea]|uniref:TonB-dependent receptor n=1 Tax=Pendulispora albinea TaxID=2741071 RepID=A0ABZ2LN19_9BACT
MNPALRFALLLLVPSVSCLTATSAFAQAKKKDNGDVKPAANGNGNTDNGAIPEVRVIGERADSLQKIPGSGNLVTQTDIERAQPYDLAEMVRRVPGLTARQDYGGGLRLDIGLRGLDPGRSRRVLILEDGIPLAINPYAEPDMYYSPPIERMRGIEVVKGSGSILFGPQTIGGVINFLTAMPPDKPHAVVDVEGGSFDYKRAMLSWGDSIGATRYLVQGVYKEGDGLRAEAFKSADVFGKVIFETGSKGQATLKIGLHDDRADSDDVGLTQAMYRADPRRTTLAPYDRLALRRYDISLTHEQRFSKSTKLKTLVYAYTTSRIWRRQDYARAPQAGITYERIIGDVNVPGGAIYFKNTNTILDRSYDVAGVEPRFEHRLHTGPVAHTFDVGARLLFERAHYQQRTGDFPTSYAGSLMLEEFHSTAAVAGYVQDRIAFRDDLMVTPGVRVEHADFTRNVTRQGSGSAVSDRDVEGKSSSTAVVPGIGMIFGSRLAHVFGGLHVGFSPPRVTSSVSPKGENLQLDSERSINYEVGTRLSDKKRNRFEVTGFLSNFQNQLISSSEGGSTELVNGGSTRHMGVEAVGALSIGKLLHFDADTDLDLGARYTLARATFTGGPNDGMLLPYAPMHTVSTNLDFGYRGFMAEVAYNYADSMYTDPKNTVPEDVSGRTGRIPGSHRVDVALKYKHAASGLSVRFLVKNALDDVFIIARRPEGIFASGFRQFIVGVRWDFEGKGRAGAAE